MIPKHAKYSNKVFITKTKESRVDELLNDTDEKTVYLPSSISIADLDQEIVRQLNEDRLMTISESKKSVIPAILFGNEKWSEFSKTWKYVDDDKNVVLPIISIKKIDTVFGSRLGDNRYFISNKKNFQYRKVPIQLENNKIGYEIYKVPNPTPIDITYEIKLFTNFSRDLNAFNTLFIRSFQDAQFYISVKGQYMPIFMESNGDDSVDDVDSNSLIVRNFNIKLKGFIYIEEEFEVIQANNRVIQITEIDNIEVDRKIKNIKYGDYNTDNNTN
jgi:hypothetical protein